MLLSIKIKAQDFNIPINSELTYRVEKEFYSDSNFFSGIKPYRISKNYRDSIYRLNQIKTRNKLFDYLLNKNLIEYKKNKLLLSLNPVAEFIPQYATQINDFLTNYKLGLKIDAFITQKLSINFTGFYAQNAYDDYWNTFIDTNKILPHYATYISKKENAYRFWSLNGYISYQPWKYFNFEAGIGKNFLGEGYRSLFLSDNSNAYPYFRTHVSIWKFRYIWMINWLKDENTNTPGTLKNKLQFTHFLSWNATKWLNFNFFESIIANPVDSLGVNYFNINYLNPVIFYRPVEFASGSADNALMGIGFNIKLLNKYHFYTQFVIDEFVISEIKAKNGWWGNKFGIQGGVKIFDLFGLKNLMIIAEANILRPYTYSYSNSILNYGNHKQALAHPAGANFKEGIFIAHYHKKRFSAQLKTIYQLSGLDTGMVSYGKDIYKPYTRRVGDYENTIAQGLRTSYWFTEFKTAWLLNSFNNMQLEISLSRYHYKNTRNIYNNFLISLGIRALIFNENLDFLY